MATFDSHGNLIKVIVTVAPSTPTAGTTVSVSNADGVILRTRLTAPFNLVVCPSTGVIDPTTSEIMRVSAIGAADSGGVGNTQLTIARQTETGGINRSVTIGDVIYEAPTAKSFTDIENALNNALYTSQVTNEVPGGLVNGANTTYTTAAVFNSGSLRVYLNGIRLKGGGVDYSENGGLNGFSMVTAPLTGDTILVDYNSTAGVLGIGTNNWITNETPTGLVNGSNTVYTTSQSYIAGTTQVYRDGQLLQGGGNDYTETTPASGTITMVTAPVTGTIILVTYQHAIAAGGNANTVNGFIANSTPTANQIPVLDSNAKLPFAAQWNDGWIVPTDTWVYASATSFTIAGVDRTGVYTVGTRIKCTVNGAQFYGTVTSSTFSTNTTVNMAANATYQLSNFALPNAGYSYAANPQGFPRYFTYTPTWTGFSAAPTNTIPFSITGGVCTLLFDHTGTSNSATFNISLPAVATQIGGGNAYIYIPIKIIDNSSHPTVMGVIGIPYNDGVGTTARVGLTIATASANAFGGFTASSNKGIYGAIQYFV